MAQRTEGEVLGDEAHGDVGVHGFWKRRRTTIFDIQICDTEAKSYGNCTSKKVLESAALRKRVSMRRRVSKDVETSPPCCTPSTVWLTSMLAPLKSKSLHSCG